MTTNDKELNRLLRDYKKQKSIRGRIDLMKQINAYAATLSYSKDNVDNLLKTVYIIAKFDKSKKGALAIKKKEVTQ